MNASEKFRIPQDMGIITCRNGFIPAEDTFFKGTRKAMRGLEENIIRELYRQRGITDRPIVINYNDEWVYEMRTLSGTTFYVHISHEWITIGSNCIF